MATKFLEPGGDATFNVADTLSGGLWKSTNAAPAVAADFVHGSHIKSIKFRPSNLDQVQTPDSSAVDAGGRISFYIYLSALPTSTAGIFKIINGSAANVINVKLTSGGILQIWNNDTSNQIGSNGSTLSTGQWYRISLAYTITSTTINRFELFVNGSSSISITNATITNISSNCYAIGNSNNDSTLDFRSSDHYTDDSTSLTDTGDIWVTAKRPNANGTTNGFTTQIGSGGSGYGTGHSPQVNERPLSNVNGWSMVGAGSAVTEEYNIENRATGDFNISNFKLVDWMGWVDVKSLAGETIQIILDGANTAQAITSTETVYRVFKGSPTYPSGTGADIGIITDTSLTTVSLYECGVVVAFIMPAQNTSSAFFDFMGPAQGYNNA